mmetsp:Transcript_20723/g.79506  ORF Transcript_20723/g.79506 Transcript_20723/m.79506 type:complete len:205 (+) Transcript_20723:463-1077(+)
MTVAKTDWKAGGTVTGWQREDSKESDRPSHSLHCSLFASMDHHLSMTGERSARWCCSHARRALAIAASAPARPERAARSGPVVSAGLRERMEKDSASAAPGTLSPRLRSSCTASRSQCSSSWQSCCSRSMSWRRNLPARSRNPRVSTTLLFPDHDSRNRPPRAAATSPWHPSGLEALTWDSKSSSSSSLTSPGSCATHCRMAFK